MVERAKTYGQMEDRGTSLLPTTKRLATVERSRA